MFHCSAGQGHVLLFTTISNVFVLCLVFKRLSVIQYTYPSKGVQIYLVGFILRSWGLTLLISAVFNFREIDLSLDSATTYVLTPVKKFYCIANRLKSCSIIENI